MVKGAEEHYVLLYTESIDHPDGGLLGPRSTAAVIGMDRPWMGADLLKYSLWCHAFVVP